MSPSQAPPAVELPAGSLIVTNPSGIESRIQLSRLPFRIGRLGDNDLVLRDSRISRHHARIVAEEGRYVIEDLQSSYGVFVNGERVERRQLRNSDRVEFGFSDSYQLVFSEHAAATQARPALPETASLGGANLARLRAMLEVARALQSSLSTDEVLSAVVEAALTVTGCERGFLLLVHGDDLEIRVARSRTGPLAPGGLRVPTRLLLRALKQRKEFLSMSFEPGTAEHTIADLELRSVICLPLVRIRSGSPQDTSALSPAQDTVGLLYLDSKLEPADLATGSRELLTTLALEASTVLEHARLLEEAWARQRIEQELKIAREIQESLMPRALPSTGWFRAAAANLPSLQVGGDYLDVRQVAEGCWATVVADVSGKGVGAALLAALLQGMFLVSPYTRMPMEEMILRLNRFLNDRTGGEQYATLFYCTVAEDGLLRWINAGHPPPLLARRSGGIESLPASGLPVGMLEDATYAAQETRLAPGDKLLIYTDGLSEARNPREEFFGLPGLRRVVEAEAGKNCREIQAAVLGEVERFTAGAPQNDDISIAVLEFRDGLTEPLP